ncbi:MAG: phenylalanine--tRNA ligase subunit beta [Candidatus Micrarchaeia archaeon]
MVSVQMSKEWLLRESGASESELLEALPQIKAGVESNGELLSLEVTGDRPDLLGRWGVLRALKGRLGTEAGLAKLKLTKSKTRLTVEESVKKIRPYALAAFARGAKFDAESIAELMQLQEKLVLTHGRRRRKVAVGIHDASTVEGDLVYKAVDAKQTFQPLGWREEASISRIMKEHDKGREYAYCLDGKHYPLFCDAKGVLSLPPIINSQRTAVTLWTTDLLFDVTGTDWEACNTALNILCHEFQDAGCKIEAVECDGRLAPEVKPHEMLLSLDDANRALGVKLEASDATALLAKQRLEATHKAGVLRCFIPRYRADFLHPVDLVEELALGYGYNEFTPKPPKAFTRGGLAAETLQDNAARDALAAAGFVEASTGVLCSAETAAKAFSEKEIVRIRNPMSSEYGCVRSSLLPSLLGLLSENTHRAYPQRVFEVGETVERGGREGTLTRRHACAASCHANADLAEATATLAHLARALGVQTVFKPSTEKKFMKGRQAEVIMKGKRVGFVGEVHPQVLENFGLAAPCVAFEIDLDSIGECKRG